MDRNAAAARLLSDDDQSNLVILIESFGPDKLRELMTAAAATGRRGPIRLVRLAICLKHMQGEPKFDC